MLASEFRHPGTPGHVSFICHTVTFLNCLGYGNTAHGTVSETAEAVRLGKWDNTLELKRKYQSLRPRGQPYLPSRRGSRARPRCPEPLPEGLTGSGLGKPWGRKAAPLGGSRSTAALRTLLGGSAAWQCFLTGSVSRTRKPLPGGPPWREQEALPSHCPARGCISKSHTMNLDSRQSPEIHSQVQGV